MDLRTIMNSDSAGVPSKPPQAQPPPSPCSRARENPAPRRASYPNETSPPVHPSHPTEPRVRPPPPPPLQPPLHSPGRSSSYGSAQSPYQHSSASSILSGIPPPPNAPSYSQGSQSFLPVARDSFAATSAPLPHPTSSLCSPFTPQPLSSGTQQTYFYQARSHSIHSVTTPSHPSTVSPTSKQQFRRETDLSFQHQDIPMKITDQPAPPSVASSFVPRKKRKRYHEPPIYAQKAPRTTGTPPAIPTRYKAGSSFPFKPPFPKRENPDDRPVSRNRSMPPRQAPTPQSTRSDVNGNAARSSTAGDSTSSLGPWEPSITGVIPHEEVTKLICDFLFQQVVMRKDIGAGPAGGSATGSGAILEVEAKLGQLVDKNRGERVRLPVLTECIISRDDPSMRIAFESSMTLAQHRSLNNFLNESVKSSMGPGSSRMPITYAHKKERDTFYEISSSALAPIVQHHLNPRHKPKVRVTTDQRTGAILARIIKCRIADLDVYSPRTNLDWRISVNLEMNYEGDINELIPASDAGNFGGRAKSRNKDRMSYRHLAYQIDLTQVATAEANNPPNPQADFEHELEIEISSAEIRRQGDLALAGDLANQYEELVKGFVDNVRVLARAVPGR
ncbi:mRNA-capping enzyme subunit beta [Coccidioides immitis H538.4]|uniref:mRNA-capping enzyme subunit beta n=1 Tax=Coccidioides immitis H538.4 TaxID=396776 RepID=A0A0J8RQ78_COCIT|nr:mRNA-capping enzyme subunit beta [Coccidioides immitis H538.4]